MSYNIDDVIMLFTHNETFKKMQKMVINNLMNVFATTDPDEVVIGDVFPNSSTGANTGTGTQAQSIKGNTA